MSTIQELQERRLQQVADARKVIDRADAEKRSISAEEQVTFDKFMADADAIKADIEKRSRLEAIESELKNTSGRKVVSDKLETREDGKKAEYRDAFDRYMRVGMRGLDNDELRALQIAANSEGGYLVPAEWETVLVQSIGQYNVMRQLATVISTASDRNIPIETAISTAAWVSEEGAIGSASDPVFDRVVLGAHAAKHIVKVSNELLQDSFFNLEAYLAEQLGRALGNLEEAAFISGSASANHPTGILVTGTSGVTCASATVPTLEEYIDLQYSVSRSARVNGVYLVGDDQAKLLRKMKDGEGRYIWAASAVAGEPDVLLGKPIYTSDAVQALGAGRTVAGFGDTKKYVIADRANKAIQRLVELYAEGGQTGFLVSERVDGKLLQADAFKTMKMHA